MSEAIEEAFKKAGLSEEPGPNDISIRTDRVVIEACKKCHKQKQYAAKLCYDCYKEEFKKNRVRV